MTEKQPPTIYDHARDFYYKAIFDSREKLASAITDTERLNALDSLEIAQIKLAQSNRRERVLKGGEGL